eukprot:15330076-Ditylum_brightwellii.AAC.2
MNEIETAAVISHTSIAEKTLMKLNQHLKSKCSKILIEIENGVPGAKTEEKIGIAKMVIEEIMRYNMDRHLEILIHDNDVFQLIGNGSNALYGYQTKSSTNGIYVLLGTDYGQGMSQFMLHLNLGSSAKRRESGCIDFKSRSLPFATIECKKENSTILRLTVEEDNEGVDHFMPPAVTKCEEDLLYKMLLQGRENMVSSRCITCKLTMQKWKTEESQHIILWSKADITMLILNNSICRKASGIDDAGGSKIWAWDDIRGYLKCFLHSDLC